MVCEDKLLSKNLVSVPTLDRMGFTITFQGGRGVVTDADGNHVTEAPLTNNNLYVIRHPSNVLG